MRIPAALALASLMLSLLAGAAGAQGGPAVTVEECVFLADFEGEPVASPERPGVEARCLEAGDAPGGRAFLEVCGKGALPAWPVSHGVKVDSFQSLQVWIRAPSSASKVPVRWLALDGWGEPLFQRRALIEPRCLWLRYSEPLALWRWGRDAVGDWSEVRAIQLVIESAEAAVLHLDEVALCRSFRTATLVYEEWVTGLAFPAGGAMTHAEPGFLVASDSPGATARDLERVLVKIRPVRAWLARIFGNAVQPVFEDRPLVLLVFKDRPGFEAFYERLGKAWRATITPPRAGGYAVQDIAGSFVDPDKGMERPVFFHETVHALVARELRLLPGNGRHGWLQEGVANYLQIVLYPESLARSTYVRHFAAPIDPEGRSFFKSLSQLLTRRAEMSGYAQLASLVAYMSAERKALLCTLAAGLASGEDVGEILAGAGTSFEKFEKDWLAWGARTFSPDSPAPDGGEVFPVPPEWVGQGSGIRSR